MNSTVAATALELVERFGWSIFRLRISHDEKKCDGGNRNCKKVVFLDEHWDQASSNDPSEIELWDWSRANSYGIDCGKSGLVVADQDPDSEEWPFPAGRIHQTGREGGRHYLYEDLIGYVNRRKLQPWGIDVRGVGGMIIGPGSYHPHGAYVVLKDEELTMAPADLAGPPESLRGTGDYSGPEYSELIPSLAAWADREQASQLEWWQTKLDDAALWPEGKTDAEGRGWELLCRDFSWALAKMAVCPWLRMDEDDAALLYDTMLPVDMASDPMLLAKNPSRPGTVERALNQKVEPPPWEDFAALVDQVYDDGTTPPAVVDVSNESVALDWLKAEVGQGALSGVFLRGVDLVRTPRIGQSGYVEPKGWMAGPAQVQRINHTELTSLVNDGYNVVKGGRRPKACLFPKGVTEQATALPDLLPRVRPLLGVTHTPIVRRDGTVLDSPGYDDASGSLYLPLAGLDVPKVPLHPSGHDLARARSVLLSMLVDFPFVTSHDRANYLGALLTPLLRPIVPPPYKLLAIGAPQRGSGKSLLAWILREVHGGVFKSEFPDSDEELRKFVTSVLDTTTGPVVQFDNVTGVLKSSVLDGLLTSPEWSDRILGRSAAVTVDNDRLWVVTGNNVHIGGDLERRTLWVTINADVERPEERRGFEIEDLEGWVRERRGELLWSLLVFIRAWAVAGMPTRAQPTSDSFGRWVAVLRGILEHAGVVGVVGHEATAQQGREDPEDVEWRVFLGAAHRVFGEEPWTCRELLEKVTPFTDSEGQGLRADELPGDLAERMEKANVSISGVSKSLGKWLSNRENRWAGGYVVKGLNNGERAKQWQVVPKAS